MKKLAFVLFFLAASLGVNAQSDAERKVATAVEKLRTAMISGKRVDLESVLSDDLSYGHSSGKIQTKEVFADEIVTKKSNFLTIDLTNQNISIAGDVAIVTHQLDASTNDGGKPAQPHLGIVLVWKNIRGEWKLIARRAFKLPADK